MAVADTGNSPQGAPRACHSAWRNLKLDLTRAVDLTLSSGRCISFTMHVLSLKAINEALDAEKRPCNAAENALAKCTGDLDAARAQFADAKIQARMPILAAQEEAGRMIAAAHEKGLQAVEAAREQVQHRQRLLSEAEAETHHRKKAVWARENTRYRVGMTRDFNLLASCVTTYDRRQHPLRPAGGKLIVKQFRLQYHPPSSLSSPRRGNMGHSRLVAPMVKVWHRRHQFPGKIDATLYGLPKSPIQTVSIAAISG